MLKNNGLLVAVSDKTFIEKHKESKVVHRDLNLIL